MNRPSVLISGASIAGPALAAWLDRYGWSVTVVERAPALRTGGQNIDVRGAGREVARRMGLEDAIRAANTGEQGLQFVDDDGGVTAAFPAGTSDTDGATAELEILRGDLAALLVEHSRPGTEYVFGDAITAVEPDGTARDAVTVSFERGPDRRFDLVVLADGMRSRTRTTVFGDEATIRPLGLYTAYLTIGRTPSDTAWWRWHNATGGRSVTLRPDNVGTTRATLSFLSRPRGYEDLDPAGQKRVLRETFAGVGWEAPRVLAELDDAELYFEATGQVQAPRWSTGRVVLLGDAAWCASPISGMGTTLALAGAYVLAGELAAHPADHRAAFAAYEAIMRPYVAKAQQLPPGTPRLANPVSRVGLAAFRTGLRIAASAPVRRLGGLLSPPADDIALPTYVPVPVPMRSA